MGEFGRMWARQCAKNVVYPKVKGTFETRAYRDCMRKKRFRTKLEADQNAAKFDQVVYLCTRCDTYHCASRVKR